MVLSLHHFLGNGEFLASGRVIFWYWDVLLGFRRLAIVFLAFVFFFFFFFLPGLVWVFLFRILSGFFLLGFFVSGFLGEFIDILRRYYIWGNMMTGKFSLSIPMVIGLRIFFEMVKKIFLQRRVWSWLRMNASDRPNTCKSRGIMIEACFNWWRPAHGWVTRMQPAYQRRITRRKTA